MKKLTYILLFIWNIGIGQTDSNKVTLARSLEIRSPKITLYNGGKVVLDDSTTIELTRRAGSILTMSMDAIRDTIEIDTGLTEDLSYLSGNIFTADISAIQDTIFGDLGEDNDPGYLWAMYDTISERWIYRREIDSIRNAKKFKYDTVKSLLMVCDSADEVNTKFLSTGEEVVSGIKSYSDTYFYWLYGFVIIQSEYTMISCPDGWIGCAVAHYGYGNNKTIGYLDSSQKPFPKDYIIWDYKIIQE